MFPLKIITLEKIPIKNMLINQKNISQKLYLLLQSQIMPKIKMAVKILEDFFTKFVEPFIKELHFFKKHPENYEIKFRTSGNKVSVDLIGVKGEFLQPLLDLGLIYLNFIISWLPLNQNLFLNNFSHFLAKN